MLNEEAFVKWKPWDGEDVNPHPTDVCEPINLACATLPALVYDLKSPNTSKLSTLQTETIRRVFQSFAARGGFLLGDATGVGKGRTIAGLLFESKARDSGFKAVWISANTRLKSDSENEINNICDFELLKNNVTFSSYTSLLNSENLKKCIAFLNSNDSEKLIILDECHTLRNNSVTAQNIEMLIYSVPNSNILYSSATAASSIKHLEYLNRLELWGKNTPFPTYLSLASAMKTHGTPLMELLSIQMRSAGSYVSRQLSFSDIVMEHYNVKLNREEEQMYNECAAMLRDNGILGGSAHQTFFQKIITGIKTKYAIQIARTRLNMGDSVIISLINTGEAFAKRMLKKEKGKLCDKTHDFKVCEEMLDELGYDIPNMPINPIDEILNAFGKDKVAELTGRTLTFSKKSNGVFESYSKGSLEDEAKKFQQGQKHIAILSRAGGVGISLHDNHTVGRRRCHIILEMPWSAEDFMQQMGRTHRSNSNSAPYYILMSTNIPSEMRFTSAIINKLSSMGALIRGDRSCCDMKWIDAPKWSASTRRSLGLFLATSRLYSQHKHMTLVELPRRRALAICGFTKNNISEVTLKSTLTKLLSNADEATEEQIRDYLSAVKTLYPQDTCSIFFTWTPDTHKFYPQPLKDKVLTLLLCQNAWETRNTLGMLPDSIIQLIIEHMAQPSSLKESAHSGDRFIEHKLKLEDLYKNTTDGILNRIMGMEISVQQCVTAYPSFLSYPTKQVKVSCFLRFIHEKAGHSINCEIDDIKLASFSEGATGVQVSVTHTPKDVEDPPYDTVFWKHHTSNRIIYVKNHEMFTSEAIKYKLEDTSQTYLESKGYIRAERREWDYYVRKHMLHCRKKCRKLAKNYYIATDKVMNCWENSQHRVLRIPPCIHFPKGLIGLLVFISL